MTVMVGGDPFRHPFPITPLHFTITCPNSTFPKVTTCLHKSNPCTKTPAFSDPESDCQSTLSLCTTISTSNPLRTVYTCITQVTARKQHPCPSNNRRWFRQFLVIYRCLDKAGGGGVPQQPNSTDSVATDTTLQDFSTYFLAIQIQDPTYRNRT